MSKYNSSRGGQSNSAGHNSKGKQHDTTSSQDGDPACKIFVGGLAQTTTESQIMKYFEQYGTVDRKELFIARGFGYITFHQSQAVERCLNKNDYGHQISGKWVDVKRSFPPRDLSQFGGKKGGGKGGEQSSSGAPSGRAEAEAPSRGAGGKNPKKPVTVTAPPQQPSRGVQEDSRVTELCAMGFSMKQCKRVLGNCGWDVNKALDKLLEEGVEADPDQDAKGSSKSGKVGAETLSTASDSVEEPEETQEPDKPPERAEKPAPETTKPTTTGKGGKKSAAKSPTQTDGYSGKNSTKASSTKDLSTGSSVTTTADSSAKEDYYTSSNGWGNNNSSAATNGNNSSANTYHQAGAKQGASANGGSSYNNTQQSTSPFHKDRASNAQQASQQQEQQLSQQQVSNANKGGNNSAATNMGQQQQPNAMQQQAQQQPQAAVQQQQAQQQQQVVSQQQQQQPVSQQQVAAAQQQNAMQPVNQQQNVNPQMNNAAQQQYNQQHDQARMNNGYSSPDRMSGWNSLMDPNGHQANAGYDQTQQHQQHMQGQQQMQQGGQAHQQPQQLQQQGYEQHYSGYYNQQAQPQAHEQQGHYNQQQYEQPQPAQEQLQRITVKPQLPYSPQQEQYNAGQQFLAIPPDLNQQIEVILYDSNGSGWSFGKDLATQQQGWFPTSCCHFDLVTTVYPFDTKPETTRPYISFQPEQTIIVEDRHDCGWWIGSVLEDASHGNLGNKGYFPGNYCTVHPKNAQHAQVAADGQQQMGVNQTNAQQQMGMDPNQQHVMAHGGQQHG